VTQTKRITKMLEVSLFSFQHLIFCRRKILATIYFWELCCSS